MATYFMPSRFSAAAMRDPKEFKKLAKALSSKIKSECSGVRWKDRFATLGRFDVADVAEVKEPNEIEKLAMICRAYGYLETEILPATPGKEFLTRL
ncbi:MAG: GYD domain-containing protein [Acidobacteria bacterium]|nr:GYD domain-containing protein [Acidobacteriota bacterium]